LALAYRLVSMVRSIWPMVMSPPWTLLPGDVGDLEQRPVAGDKQGEVLGAWLARRCWALLWPAAAWLRDQQGGRLRSRPCRCWLMAWGRLARVQGVCRRSRRSGRQPVLAGSMCQVR
jgi:hypothetical protein